MRFLPGPLAERMVANGGAAVHNQNGKVRIIGPPDGRVRGLRFTHGGSAAMTRPESGGSFTQPLPDSLSRYLSQFATGNLSSVVGRELRRANARHSNDSDFPAQRGQLTVKAVRRSLRLWVSLAPLSRAESSW